MRTSDIYEEKCRNDYGTNNTLWDRLQAKSKQLTPVQLAFCYVYNKTEKNIENRPGKTYSTKIYNELMKPNTTDTYLQFLFKYDVYMIAKFNKNELTPIEFIFRETGTIEMVIPKATGNNRLIEERISHLKEVYSERALRARDNILEYPIKRYNSRLDLFAPPTTREDNSAPTTAGEAKSASAAASPAPTEVRPFLASYARLAHKFAPHDSFIDEFVASCHAYVDTIDARARAKRISVDVTSTTTPKNFYNNVKPVTFGEPNNVDPVTFVEPDEMKWQGLGDIRRDKCLGECKKPMTHIITNSVEPLVYALLWAPKDDSERDSYVTIEFEQKNRSIDVFELRDTIENQQWCGRIFEGADPQFHNLLTFITLLLIGSSSGIPLYASRNWNVVSRTWRDMVKNSNDPEKWLTRFVKGNMDRVEICERRFLELIIRLIATTHVSEEEPSKFKPGAMAYVRYVEKFYERMKKNEQLGYIKTKPWVDAGEQKFFAQRLRFMLEFSYPENMDDIREAVRIRLSHWLEHDATKIVFV